MADRARADEGLTDTNRQRAADMTTVDAATERLIDMFLAADENADTIGATTFGIRRVVEALLSLPVEQRMEAMGMERCDAFNGRSVVPRWKEADA